MEKTVALSTLQSLVSEHNKPIYQEALDCIKAELTKQINSKPRMPICPHCDTPASTIRREGRSCCSCCGHEWSGE